MTIEGDRLYVAAGCNRLSFSWSAGEDGEVVVSNPSSTRMMCTDALMAQDRWLMAFLVDDGVAWTVEGDQLVVEGEGVSLVLAPSVD